MLVNPYLGNKMPIVKESSFLSKILFLTSKRRWMRLILKISKYMYT